MKIFTIYTLTFYIFISVQAQVGIGGSPREMTVLDLNFRKYVPWVELKSVTDSNLSSIRVLEGVMVYNMSNESLSEGYYIWEKGQWVSWKPVKGFIGSRTHLKSLTDRVTIPNPVDGLVVYNLNENSTQGLNKGYYEWLNGRWESWLETRLSTVVTKGGMKDILGYEADSYGINAPESYTIPATRGVLNKVKCAVWNTGIESNRHTYCAYKFPVDMGMNWSQAFALAKSMGGYMVTITTNAEWEWLKMNMGIGGASSLLDKNIWIGYVKVKYADESSTRDSAKEFTWITGEESKISWSGNTTTENNFAKKEPNDGGVGAMYGTEGCTHIWYYNTSIPALLNRQWNDTKCSNLDEGYGFEARRKINAVIVEFNQ